MTSPAGPDGLDPPVVEPKDAAAIFSKEVHVVAHDHDRLGVGNQGLHPVLGLGLEGVVAGREHFVDDEDLRLDGRGNRKGQPHEHARRIVAHRHVEELAQLAEVGDGLHAGLDRAGRFALQVAAEADVVPAVGLGLEAQRNIEQAS